MSKNTSRLGFHYFPDSTHYREQDLQIWLPVLQQLGASWLTLIAPNQRAIPEFFLNGLISEGIQPILHFPLMLNGAHDKDDFAALFRTYARWGVRNVAMFDRPNSRTAWSAGIWAQEDLVERFLDRYLPLAEAALDEGLTPVFPPMQPGGDYWDLAFLQMALRGMVRRDRSRLLDTLVIGAYAWVNARPLDWGLGGTDRWPGARPYFTPSGVQDQIGFRIFDWYEDVTKKELGRVLPIFLLRAGALPGEMIGLPGDGALQHAQINLAIAQLLSGDSSDGAPIPNHVLACNFWLLAAEKEFPRSAQAWFQIDGKRLPVVDVFRQWVGARGENEIPVNRIDLVPEPTFENELEDPITQVHIEKVLQVDEQNVADIVAEEVSSGGHEIHPIAHYVLLPLYAWGAGEWDLERIQPLLQENHPTVGFSLAEARLARRVTVVGGPGAISDDVLGMLRLAGCQVERLLADGTVIAP